MFKLKRNHKRILNLLINIVFGYVLGTEHIRQWVNEVSDVWLGRWWDVLIKIVAPIILVFIAIASFAELLVEGYEGLPAGALIAGGGVVLFRLFVAIQFARRRIV